MGAYQYTVRADRLRRQGAQLRDFGSRVLREGYWGDDVSALQSYLSEEGYFNSGAGLAARGREGAAARGWRGACGGAGRLGCCAARLSGGQWLGRGK